MEVIGVIGTEKGVGATHLSLMLGVFLSIVKGYKVAVVELNRPGSIRQAGVILKSLKPSFRKKLLKLHKKSVCLKFWEIKILEISESRWCV